MDCGSHLPDCYADRARRFKLMAKHFLVFCLSALAIGAALLASGQDRQADKTSAAIAPAAAAATAGGRAPVRNEVAERTEGEKRFKANCGRCHMAPQKFPPRMMATIVRHMRVRATLTDEDARLILHYMTQ
jgi:mono/diheme cytochrome c family protein